jgi:large subunit ribosomal protein L4
MEVAVVDIQGKKTGRKVQLSETVFGIEPNTHAVYLDVKSHLANKRQGTHKAKERGEIKGSTRKIKKQKGTGTARAGSIKNYSQKVNKKVKRLARKSALSIKAQENAIIVLEDFQFDTVKTANYLSVLKSLGLENKKSVVVLAEPNKNVYLSSRNIKHSQAITSSELNTYKIVNTNSLVLFESAVAGIETLLNKA